ncbi:MAG TPA: sugar ABC transporter permease [Trebonia sp.]|nr:sugar ABC transporter permease [Trebonia sp.]
MTKVDDLTRADPATPGMSPPSLPRPRRGRGAAARVRDTGLLLPAAALVAIILYLPFVYTCFLSLMNYNGLGPMTFAGLSNYGAFFTSGNLSGIVTNTALWVAGTLILPVGLGLAVAVLTHRSRSRRIVHLIFLIPYGMSGAAVGVLWGFILQPGGALNELLSALHLPGGDTSLLAHSPLSTVLMIVAATWQGLGVNVLLFAVGLQSLPRQPLEAARVDGAGGWRLFRSITWPLLRPITAVVVGLAIVNSLKTFDIVWILTGGGPGLSSATLAVSMYQTTFSSQQYGEGAAIAVLLTIVATAAAFLYLRRQISAPKGALDGQGNTRHHHHGA